MPESVPETEEAEESEEPAILQPYAKLPKPEAPPGLHDSPPSSPPNDDVSEGQKLRVDVPAIGKLIRKTSNDLSSAILKKLLSFKENAFTDEILKPKVTEFNLSGLKVTVKLKRETEQQTYGFKGGLVPLNSLRNSGEFEQRLKEMIGSKCHDDAPASPVYGFDDLEEELTDEMIGIVRVLRLRLPIQDRLMKMKIVKNCFAGNEMVEVIIQQLDCGRRQEPVEGKGDDEAALAIWDCGSPLYDSYELASVTHLIERHLMAFPYLGGSSRRFLAKFSRSSSSETTSTTSTTTAMKEMAKGSNSMEENMSKFLGIKKMSKKKGLFGGKKYKTKKMKTTGFSGFYSRLGLWRKKECR